MKMMKHGRHKARKMMKILRWMKKEMHFFGSSSLVLSVFQGSIQRTELIDSDDEEDVPVLALSLPAEKKKMMMTIRWRRRT